MNGTQAIDVFKYRLSRFTDTSAVFISMCLSELNQAKTRLEAEATLPWWLVSEESYFILTVGEERARLPPDFLREIETANLQVEDPDSGEFFNDLKKGFLDEARIRWPGTGRPRSYSIIGNYFHVLPIPDKAYKIWMPYAAKADPITAEEDSVWLDNQPDYIISEAGIPLATTLRNVEALQLFTAMNAKERDTVMRNARAREMENFDPNPED